MGLDISLPAFLARGLDHWLAKLLVYQSIHIRNAMRGRTHGREQRPALSLLDERLLSGIVPCPMSDRVGRKAAVYGARLLSPLSTLRTHSISPRPEFTTRTQANPHLLSALQIEGQRDKREETQPRYGAPGDPGRSVTSTPEPRAGRIRDPHRQEGSAELSFIIHSEAISWKWELAYRRRDQSRRRRSTVSSSGRRLAPRARAAARTSGDGVTAWPPATH